jgi:23S rRNA pseudouridine2605 synthase
MSLVKKGFINRNTGRVPLYRALSKLGKASREESKILILEGKVKVHGKVETDPHRMINPDRAHIEITGTKVIKDSTRVVVFHKPAGYLTTKRDPEGRPTIYDLLPEEFRSFHPVGRLDQNTSGLLLMTNSSRVSHFLTDPENGIPRTYIVQVRGMVTQDEMDQMLVGVMDAGEKLCFSELKLLKVSGKESKLEVTLKEGKYREIRRMFLAFEHEVTKLKRISYGSFSLEDLPAGKIKECTVGVHPEVSDATKPPIKKKDDL